MKIIYSCEEHIDDAMDDIVDEYETFPVITECLNNTCEYCSKESKYEIQANS